MIILVHNAPIELAEAYPQVLGQLITPGTGLATTQRYLVRGLPWAMDNDCFRVLRPRAYLSTLQRCARLNGCLWVVVPDVVADHQATMVRWREWAAQVAAFDVPLAFVAQNGAASHNVPWDEIRCLFIGGDTAWKIGAEAHQVVSEAKRRGKWVHMGRVNSRTRLLYAASIGCDSVDGTGFSRYGRAQLPWAIRWASVQQTRMF